MKVVAIVQARMGSTRLPGKVLMDIAGAPMLSRCTTRLSRAKRVNSMIIATSALPGDEVIASWCAEHSLPCARGSENDLTDRFYRTALQENADIIVRVCGDTPLIDPDLVDVVVSRVADGVEYATNFLGPDRYPHGLECEAFRLEALERAWKEDTNAAWREHVTPYIYRHPECFTIASVTTSQDVSGIRWSVDTIEDIEVVRHVFRAFGHDRFSWQEALALARAHPEWNTINAGIRQRTVG